MTRPERPTAIRIVSADDWWRDDPVPRGSVCFAPLAGEAVWWMCCPLCGGRASLASHTVTQEADGTLTIAPSLLCPNNDLPADHKRACRAHYFVRHNQITWA